MNTRLYFDRSPASRPQGGLCPCAARGPGGRGAAPRTGCAAFVSRCHGGLGDPAAPPQVLFATPGPEGTAPGQRAQPPAAPRPGTGTARAGRAGQGREDRSVMAVKGVTWGRRYDLKVGLGCLRENIVVADGRPGRAGPRRWCRRPPAQARRPRPLGLRSPSHRGGGPGAPSFPKGGASGLGRPGLEPLPPRMEPPRLPPPPRAGPAAPWAGGGPGGPGRAGPWGAGAAVAAYGGAEGTSGPAVRAGPRRRAAPARPHCGAGSPPRRPRPARSGPAQPNAGPAAGGAAYRSAGLPQFGLRAPWELKPPLRGLQEVPLPRAGS